MYEAELPPLPEHFCPIGLLGANGYFQREARNYAEDYARAAQAPLLAEIERLRAERNMAMCVIKELVRLDDFYIPGPPPHEWDTAWSAARTLIAAKDTTP